MGSMARFHLTKKQLVGGLAHSQGGGGRIEEKLFTDLPKGLLVLDQADEPNRPAPKT